MWRSGFLTHGTVVLGSAVLVISGYTYMHAYVRTYKHTYVSYLYIYTYDQTIVIVYIYIYCIYIYSYRADIPTY